jgi:hypothetical protein
VHPRTQKGPVDRWPRSVGRSRQRVGRTSLRPAGGSQNARLRKLSPPRRGRLVRLQSGARIPATPATERRVGSRRGPACAGLFRQPPSEPDLRLSPHPALQCLTVR